jgi:antitoxin component YwqK of YwqJK toxin-antitoxin module
MQRLVKKGTDIYGTGLAKKDFIGNWEKDGKWEWYYPNGKLESVVHYDDNELSGPSVSYDQKGNKISTTDYESDWNFIQYNFDTKGRVTNKIIATGIGKFLKEEYFDSGEVKTTTRTFSEDYVFKKEVKEFFKNGQLSSISFFLGDEPIDTWKTFDSEGKLLTEKYYPYDYD